MPLDEATVVPVVDAWSASLAAPWTDSQKDQLVDRLVELSSHVVPHLVMDVALSHARQQEYLLGRTLARVEDWLTMVAASHRRTFKLDAIRHNPGTEEASLGLRSATLAEIEALPGVGGALAVDIGRYLAGRPGSDELKDLLEINGIGPTRLAQLQRVAYLDQASVGFASPALWAFVMSPTVPNAVALLERSDFSLMYGDHNAVARRIAGAVGSLYERFAAFLELVTKRAELASTPTGGSLASQADRWVRRHRLRADRLAATEPSTGMLLVNEAYVDATKAVIDNANTSLELMVFLGTAAAGDGNDPAPLPLVEALEAAAARGVDVRVILDQDDGGEPYKSFFINKPLVDRFKANGVSVKFDEKDTLLHSKVLIADGATTIVGSHNWTRAGFNRTHELSVQIENNGVANTFHARFEALWNQLPALP